MSKISADILISVSQSKVFKIYQKYYEKNISLEQFYQIISSDPTTPIKNDIPDKLGQYSKWLLSIYKKGNFKIEDCYKAKDYLTQFHDLKRTNILHSYQRDIGKLSSLPELYKIVVKFSGTGKPQQDENYLISDRFLIKTERAKLFFENEQWLVVIPSTYEAAQFYGHNSQWCTQYPNMYESYTKDGPLYVFIDKTKLNQHWEPTRRLQFHFESNQFMNINDSSIDSLSSFFKNSDELICAFAPVICKNINYTNSYTDLSEDFILLIESICRKRNDITNNLIKTFSIALKKGYGIPEKVFTFLPELVEIKINIYSEKGWTLSEEVLLSMSDEKLYNTIKKKIEEIYYSFPVYYYKLAPDELKEEFFNTIIKNKMELSIHIYAISEPRLLNIYINHLLNLKQAIPEFLFLFTTEEQKDVYADYMLNNILQISINSFKTFDEAQKEMFIKKYVKEMCSYLSNEFFNELSDNLKNFFFSKIAQKNGGLDKVYDFLTEEQISWGKKYSFL